eukprot:384322_1
MSTMCSNVDELKSLMKVMGVSVGNIEKFQDEIDDCDHNLESIKEDMSDKEQSMLFDFFRDELEDEYIYDIVKDIIDGRQHSKTLDYFLGMYYKRQGRYDYYDIFNNGKLMMFLNDNEIDSDTMIEELENRLDSQECQLIELGVDDYGYYPNEMYDVIKYCNKYNKLPIPISMDNLVENISSNERILNWKRISNVIYHELYPQISHKFLKIVNENKYKTVEEILNALKNKTRIDNDEIKYIQQLIERAIAFFYPAKNE